MAMTRPPAAALALADRALRNLPVDEGAHRAAIQAALNSADASALTRRCDAYRMPVLGSATGGWGMMFPPTMQPTLLMKSLSWLTGSGGP